MSTRRKVRRLALDTIKLADSAVRHIDRTCILSADLALVHGAKYDRNGLAECVRKVCERVNDCNGSREARARKVEMCELCHSVALSLDLKWQDRAEHAGLAAWARDIGWPADCAA